ncbi:hypothetical protein ES705_21139 [subsurface metagenome]
MFELLLTALSLLSTVLLLVMITFLYKFNRDMPDIEQILVDVGENIGEQLTGIFKDPMVKQSMSVMGKKSGEMRASTALKNKVAERALGQNVLLKKALDYLDITAIEGLELLNDPTIGPTIRGLMANFQQGAGGLLSGLGGGGQRQGQRNDGNRVPNMS